MFKIRFILIIIFSLFNIQSQAQKLNWHQQINGNTNDVVDRIVTDVHGNYYVSGTYGKVTDLDPGPGTFVKSCWFLPNIFEFHDAFLAKYDSAFNVQFIYTFGGTHQDDITDFDFDSQGNIIVTALFKDSADLDPGPGKNMIYSQQWLGIVVMKLNSSGQLLWHFELGSRLGVTSGGVAVDASDNIYVFGNYLDSIDLDPGLNNVIQHSTNSRDIFVAKYDSGGNYLNHINLGGMLQEFGSSIEFSDSNFIYLFGSYRDTIDFDPGLAQYKIGSSHQQDLFFAKYDTSFNLIWAKSIGGQDDQQSHELVLDDSDNLYIVGNYRGSMDLDPGPQTNLVSPVGSFDIYYAKYNTNGDYQWGGSFGGNDYDYGYGIDASDTAYVYVTGYFIGSMDANPGPSFNNISAYGGQSNAFITQLRSDGSYVRTTQFGTSAPGDNVSDVLGISGHRALFCGSYSHNTDIDPTDDTVIISSQGSYDGLMSEYLMCEAETSLDSITICQGSLYVFPDGDTSSLPIVDTSEFLNRFLCDSFIVTYLSVDSFYLIHRTEEMCFGDTFMFPDSSTSANSIIDTSYFYSSRGCDSLIVTNLEVTRLDTSLQIAANLLISNEEHGSYQWLICDSSFAIVIGENDSVFEATMNGHYAVALSFNGCHDTSGCYEIQNIGIRRIKPESEFEFYPNPTQNQIFFKCEPTYIGKEFFLTDNQGRVLLTFTPEFSNVRVDLSEIESGIYYIHPMNEKAKPLVLIRR